MRKFSEGTQAMTPAVPRANVGAQTALYCAFNKTKESFLGLKITRADTFVSRLRGLLGTITMASDEGLWMVPSRGIHTIGLVFPIDIVYLDAESRVIELVEHLGPLRIGPLRLKCSSVLELPPHTIYSSQTRVGDEIVICLPEALHGHVVEAGAGASAKETAR